MSTHMVAYGQSRRVHEGVNYCEPNLIVIHDSIYMNVSVPTIDIRQIDCVSNQILGLTYPKAHIFVKFTK